MDSDPAELIKKYALNKKKVWIFLNKDIKDFKYLEGTIKEVKGQFIYFEGEYGYGKTHLININNIVDICGF